MSQRSKEVLIYVLAVVTIAGGVVYFRYHQFQWWLLIIPATSIPVVVLQHRRQSHWDDLRSRRHAKAAEQEPPAN
jgi:hypothetical protein